MSCRANRVQATRIWKQEERELMHLEEGPRLLELALVLLV